MAGTWLVQAESLTLRLFCVLGLFMSSQAETRAEQAQRMLGEAAEIMLSAMRHMHDQLAAAEGPEAATGAALALQRVNRGLRQTLMLAARMEADAARAARAAEADLAERRSAARKAETEDRRARVRYLVQREILEQSDSREDAEGLLEDLDGVIDVYVEGFDFEAEPLEHLIAILCREVGLEPPAAPNSGAMGGARSDPPRSPPASRLVQQPDLGWAPAGDTS